MTFLTGKKQLLGVVVLSLILLILGGVFSLSYNHYSAGLNHTVPESVGLGSGQGLHEMRGISMDSWANGSKLLTVKAERLSVEKKKFGFFRFGLMNVVNITDCRIELYDFFAASSDNPNPAAGGDQPHLEQLLFNSLIKQTMPYPAIKGISAIEVKSVSLRIYDKKSLLTEINADSLYIGARKGSITFHGNVRVESHSDVLTTEELVLLPRQALLETNQHFKLKASEKEFEGYHLVTDFFLNQFPEYSHNKQGDSDRTRKK